MREFKTLGIVLGMRYANSPIIVADGSTPPPGISCCVYRLHTRDVLPPLANRRLSLYDHFGLGFTLLITEGDEHAAERLAEAAPKSNIPLKVFAPMNARLHQMYEARYALICRDQHVAWRGNHIPADCEALLTHVTGASRKAGTTLGAGTSSSAVDGTGIEVPFLPNRRSSWRSLFLSQGVRLSAESGHRLRVHRRVRRSDNFPVCRKIFPAIRLKIPCFFVQGICPQMIEFLR